MNTLNRCPECGSKQTRKVSVIYEEGTADTHQRGGFAGTTFERDGIHSLSGHYGGRGRVETKLAQRVAPPHLQSPGDFYIRVAILGSLACLLLMGICLFILDLMLPVLVLLVIMVGVAFWAFSQRETANRWHQERIYQPQLEQWRQSYYCLRCGHTFIP